MYSIKLVNMPFSALTIPSIALTQLKALLQQQFRDQVDVEILYLNHDFGNYFGPERYNFVAFSGAGHVSGFGDWFFRKSVFPDIPDNTKEYFDRYGVHYGSDYFENHHAVFLKKRETVDAFLSHLIEEYELDHADVVGFTSMFFQTLASSALARQLKERNPEQIIVMGGANCEHPMGLELVRNFSCFDFIFSGYSLISFPEFVSNLMNGQEERCHQIDGVFSRRNHHLIGQPDAPRGGPAIAGRELDINGPLIRLDYDSFLDSFEERLIYSGLKPYLLFETSRGCWWGARSHCTFCGLNGGNMAFRAMNPELAIEQFCDLFDSYATRVDHFSSVDNIVPKNYLSEVFPRLKVPENITMFYEVKADLTKEEMKIMADAHVYEIQPGIESLATSTLKLMRKGTTAFNNINFLKYALLHGIYPAWNLLVGFPGENAFVYEKYLRDLHLIRHLPPPDGAYPVRFDRYSPYFTQAKKYELQLKPLPFYALCFPFGEEVLKNLAYYFKDQNYNAEYFLTLSEYIQPLQEIVERWKNRWIDAKSSGQPYPGLYFLDKEYSNTIHDSRSSEPKEYKISDAAKCVLDICERPKTMQRIIGEAQDFTPNEIEEAIEEIKSKGLIFTEGQSILNLTFPHEPVPTHAKFFHTISSD